MKKAFQDMLHELGEVNPTHAYHNGSRTSKDNEDPSWSISFKTRRTQKTSSALKDFICVVIIFDRNIVRRTRELEQETWDLDMKNKQKKNLKASYGVTTPQELHSIMAEGDIDNLTMEQYIALTRWNQALSVVKPDNRGNANFKIKIQFMRELREHTFFGNKNNDAHEHVERVLDIPSEGEHLLQWAGHYESPIARLEGANSWHDTCLSFNSNPDYDDHSQKWHDSSFSRNIDSSSNTEGITAIVSELDSLGQDMKKLKENMHAIRVGCQTYEGYHLDKECPLNEEVKRNSEKLAVKIDKFVFPVDFVILDMVEDFRMPIILGRPLLAMTHSTIDIYRKSISLEVGNEKVIFKMRSSFTTTTVESVRAIKREIYTKEDNLMKIDYDLFLYDSESCEFNRLLGIDPDIFYL
ncbi:zinc knuckle CX2CX4HX4C containing protein [Tanacetum coccineum]